MSRRPSVTIYDYPEDLNPFKDDREEMSDKITVSGLREKVRGSDKEKEDKKKFWTFGRNKKKRSHSFSIKSTWNGIFGKKKEPFERSPTISTVSSSYQRASYNDHSVPPPRPSRDHQEFNEALGTLARRRKHTLDNSSRYGSSLTMNGDPGRIYDGCPQDTTVSIMGDLTPKPPARRFGQVSPKPTDKIPPLDYGHKSDVRVDDRDDDGTPIPPKRGGFRASQRLTVPQEPEDDKVQMRNGSFTDENENMSEDFVFKRCSNDAVRKSNLSINSCISVGSVYASGRKKRRAPLPPGKKPEPLESPQENHVSPQETSPDPLELSRVAEDINEMTKKTQQLDDLSKEITEKSNSEVQKSPKTSPKEKSSLNHEKSVEENEVNSKIEIEIEIENSPESKIEFTRTPEKPLEIIKDITIIDDDDDDVVMREKTSSLGRNDSFSVKEEIEKIEKQIKILESTKSRTRTTSFTSSLDEDDPLPQLQRGGSRRSLQETRRNFFRDLTKHGTSDDIKIEIREFPREQKEIKIVRLSDPPVADDRHQEAVKIIELHISEPIKQKSEFSDLEINPIPKPRRHTSRGSSEEQMMINNEEENYGNSV